LNVLRPRCAGPRNGAVEMVYRTGFTAAFNGRTNTATHANTLQQKIKYYLLKDFFSRYVTVYCVRTFPQCTENEETQKFGTNIS